MNRQKWIGIALTFSVIAVLFFSGSAEAITLGISDLVSTIAGSSPVSFLAKVDLHTEDVLLDTANFTVNLVNSAGQQNYSCTFDVYGNPITTCNDLSISLQSSNSWTKTYGYGFLHGYGYDFSTGTSGTNSTNYSATYGYGYAYIPGTGHDNFNNSLASTAELIFNITWTTPLVASDITYTVSLTVHVSDGTNQVRYDTTLENQGEITVQASSVEGEAPVVELYEPENASFATQSIMSFNFSVTDDQDINLTCALYIDNALNSSTTALAAVITTIQAFNLESGSHYWFVNCTDSSGNSNVSETRNLTIDTEQFNITTIQLANTTAAQTANISVTGSINLTSSKALDSSTLGDMTLTVANLSGEMVFGDVSYNSTTRVITFAPWARLEYQTTYNVTVTSDVKDLAGNTVNLISNWTFTFTTMLQDTDNDGVPDDLDSDLDGDGVDDINESVIGDAGTLITEIPEINLSIGGFFEFNQIFEDPVDVVIYSGDDPFTGRIMDIPALELQNQSISFASVTITADENESEGSIVIYGLSLPTNKTKTVYVQNKTGRNKVCVKDAKVTTVRAISQSCNGTSEVALACDGTARGPNQAYACIWNSTVGKLQISGLTHSAVKETEKNCSESWGCTSWSSCSSNTQTRTCTDANHCGTVNDRPSLAQSCTSGTTTTTTSSTGGGGGGGGAPTATPGKFSYYFPTLLPGAIEVMNVTEDSVVLREIRLSVRERLMGIRIEIVQTTSRPEGPLVSPPNPVYKYLNIKKTLLDDNHIERAIFQFEVEKAWLDANNADKDNIILMKYSAGWWPISAKVISETSSKVKYEATTGGLSIYAITLREVPVVQGKPVEEEEKLADIPEDKPVIPEKILPTPAEKLKSTESKINKTASILSDNELSLFFVVFTILIVLALAVIRIKRNNAGRPRVKINRKRGW